MINDLLNYVENKLADNLVSRGGDSGKLFAVGKFLTDENHNMIRFNLKTLDDLSYNMMFYKNIGINSPEKVTNDDREEYKKFWEKFKKVTTQKEKEILPII